MARPAKFTAAEILDAAGRAAQERGREATIADVARGVGAPVGSIYHRFESREELFVALWLRAIRRFHVGLFEAMAEPDPDRALVRCAVHIPGFCRAHPSDAVAMTLYRHADLVTGGPDSLREDIVSLNDDVSSAMRELTARRYGRATERRIGLVNAAVVEGPYGLVRRYLGDPEGIPLWIDEIVVASCTSILALGDHERAE